jgi:hypothetical protein
VLAGPTIPANTLRVAATDSFGVALARKLAPGANVQLVSSRGALDLVDSGADVLVTDRYAVIRYAASRTDFAVIPLPWDRQYAFVSANQLPVDNAVDAVNADARKASQRCPVTSIERPPIPIRVRYAADDSIARALAERLVGLGMAQRAVPFGHDSLMTEAYIAAWPIDSASCNVGTLHAVPLVDTRSHLIVRRGAVGVAADTAGNPRLLTQERAP